MIEATWPCWLVIMFGVPLTLCFSFLVVDMGMWGGFVSLRTTAAFPME